MMSKLMRLLMLVMVVVLLAACGAPAYVNEAAHGETDDHAHAEDTADDHAHEEDTAGSEDEVAEDESSVAEEDAADAEDEAAEPEAEAGAEEDAAEDTSATEDTSAAGDTSDTEAAAHDHGEVTPVEEIESPGDSASGEALFNTLYTEVGFACATCHNVDSEERLIGPGLLNVSLHGAQHVEGMGVLEYLHQSIVEPNAYIVPDYPENLMPQTYSELLTEDEINDIIAYLLTLEG